MPKLKESENQAKDNLIRAYIAKNKVLNNMSDEQIILKLHLSRSAYYHKRKKPSTFTLGELRRLKQALKLSTEEMSEFI